MGINRNIVECKWKSLPVRKWRSWSINRNIVECKSLNLACRLTVTSVLIETLWNVNQKMRRKRRMDILVLIETLWNVNEQIHNGPLHVRNIVLIETLWNVNRDFGIVLLRSVHRINRNIVECKSCPRSTYNMQIRY